MGGVRLEARGSGPTPVNDTRAGNGAAEGGQQAGRARGRQDQVQQRPEPPR